MALILSSSNPGIVNEFRECGFIVQEKLKLSQLDASCAVPSFSEWCKENISSISAYSCGCMTINDIGSRYHFPYSCLDKGREHSTYYFFVDDEIGLAVQCYGKSFSLRPLHEIDDGIVIG